MDEAKRNLSTKLTQLQITRSKTKDVGLSGSKSRMERQKDILQALGIAAEKARATLEELKISGGEKVEEIAEWSGDVEKQIATVDEDIDYLTARLAEVEQADIDKSRKQQFEFQQELFEQKLKFKELEAKQTGPSGSQVTEKILTAKLPKLSITKFNGEYVDWRRFWGQFVEEVDKSGMAPITKFSYLKEFVDTKVRKSIDGLPFTAEGYNRAKSILEERYGKESEIIKAYVKDIIQLPTVNGSDPGQIHQFYERLVYNVQSLETMGKLGQVNGNVPLILDKLSSIRSDLVSRDDDWQDWDFVKLCEALRSWIRRNPIDKEDKNRRRGTRVYNTQHREAKGCVYCGEPSHKGFSCKKVTTPSERKRILAEKKLCFNCTGPRHRASDCKSTTGCQMCSKRHHTSICEAKNPDGENMMSTCDGDKVIHPIVVIKVDGVECRALVDSGAASSYASAKLLDFLKKKPKEVKYKKVEMLMATTTTRMEIHNATISSKSGDYQLEVDLIKVNKGKLLEVENPHYEKLVESYSHLRGVEMDDCDTKPYLPVHVILGAGVFAKIKTDARPRVGKQGDPVAEHTKLGWFMLSPGEESLTTRVLLTQTNHVEYDELCRLDVLGLADSPQQDQKEVYAEFREQLTRDEAGWYETGLPWKGNHPPLSTNEQGSLNRLRSLKRRLVKSGMDEAYGVKIKEQKSEGIVEPANDEAKGVEFYIPHKPVLKENAETTKLRIVYDASAKASEDGVSLNDCLNTGPALQNNMWNVLVRSRAHPVAVNGDIKQAFLQVRVKQEDRDALRFHWRPGEQSEIETLRFTRVMFGLTPSPFLLGGVIEHHLDSWESRRPDAVAELRKSLYVDDLLSGGATVGKAREIKQQAVEIFDDAAFTLHKWHSNEAELEDHPDLSAREDETFAKQQLGKPKEAESSLLGLGWNKKRDEIAVSFPEEQVNETKRGVLRKLASIYDPLGLVSPLTLEAKMLYRAICDQKVSWDNQLPVELKRTWKKWEGRLPRQVKVPRSLAAYKEPVQSIELHGFGDASGDGVGATAYAVVTQESGVTQRLVAAKARLAKKSLTIPRLELVAAHMVTNLLTNVKDALSGFPIVDLYGWTDSTVVLHWVTGGGQYKQFVENRIRKIQAKSEIKWRHVPTEENPADLASRGGDVQHKELWWSGPEWLTNPEDWPPEIISQASFESQAEARVAKEVFAGAVENSDQFDHLLAKYELTKVIRIMAWIARFIYNCQHPKDVNQGALTTSELLAQHNIWIKRAQENSDIQQDRLRLNLQPDKQGILQCRGRIQGRYPVYLPDSHLYTKKLVRREHLRTLHGGVQLTMTAVRKDHWVPRLRRLVKKTLRECHGCRRFQARALATPPPGNLPEDRTKGTYPFQIIGVDYAGPIRYKKRAKVEGRAYVALYTCSLCRALYLDLMASLETQEFLLSLKRFIARKGRPQKIYSDNGTTFVGAANWLKKVNNDEKLNQYLAENKIVWQFNLSRAPWWGGQFERMVGLMKNALRKTIGNGLLSWTELEEVLLDIEVCLNDRPLSYVEDDVEFPILTPNTLMFQRTNAMPEEQPHHCEDIDLRRRARYLRKCKNAMWARWSKEYLRGLRERHNLSHKGEQTKLSVGDVVIIKSDEKNRGKWPLGIVVELFPGRDGVVRAVKLRAGKSFLERPIQHLYPLELSVDRPNPDQTGRLNVDAKEFQPKRLAAVTARDRIKQILEDEEEEQ